MKTIVLDLEFCKVKKIERENAFPLREEIIEFGAIMLDDEMNEISYYKSYVKPAYSSVNKHIQKLTGISNEMLINQRMFPEVMEEFMEWIGEGDIQIYSWSMNDYVQLKSEVDKKMDAAKYQRLFVNWVDAQKEFARGLGIDKDLSLSCAVSAIDENFDGEAHDALNDAKNTAKIVMLMEDQEAFDRKTKSIQELFKPKEDTTSCLGSMFADLFESIVVA